MKKVILLVALILAGCSANVGYQPNVSGQEGRAESGALGHMDRSDASKIASDRAAADKNSW